MCGISIWICGERTCSIILDTSKRCYNLQKVQPPMHLVELGTWFNLQRSIGNQGARKKFFRPKLKLNHACRVLELGRIANERTWTQSASFPLLVWIPGKSFFEKALRYPVFFGPEDQRKPMLFSDTPCSSCRIPRQKRSPHRKKELSKGQECGDKNDNHLLLTGVRNATSATSLKALCRGIWHI